MVMPVHPTPRRAAYSNQAPRPGAGLRNPVARPRTAFAEAATELPHRRRLDGLVRIDKYSWRAERRPGIENAEEEIGIHVVVIGNRPAIGYGAVIRWRSWIGRFRVTSAAVPRLPRSASPDVLNPAS